MKFLHEFLRYSDGSITDNGWWKISEDGTKLLNRCGGYHSYEPSEGDIICEEDSWNDLDYSYLIKNESPYGWIDRNGKYYGCEYADHDNIAEFVFNKTSWQLECEGWIKVYRGFARERETYINDKWSHLVTPEQLQTLSEKQLEDTYVYIYSTLKGGVE